MGINPERSEKPSELLSTEFFYVIPAKHEFIGTYNVEITNEQDSPQIFLNRDPESSKRSIIQTQHGDVVIENVSAAGYEALQKIFDANSQNGMQAVKRALTETEFLAWQRPFMNRVY